MYATMPIAHGMEAKAMPHNIMSVTTTLATNKGSLMSNKETWPSNGIFHDYQKVFSFDE
jgi:hypothetical protein